MKLSEGYGKYRHPVTTYAVCTICNLAWEDDMVVLSVLMCPKCRISGLLRGVENLEEYPGVVKDISEGRQPILRPTGKVTVETIPIGKIMEQSRQIQAQTAEQMKKVEEELSGSKE